jgi:hypothetical protein
VRYAIEVRNGLVERSSSVPGERRIEFRAGIHSSVCGRGEK